MDRLVDVLFMGKLNIETWSFFRRLISSQCKINLIEPDKLESDISLNELINLNELCDYINFNIECFSLPELGVNNIFFDTVINDGVVEVLFFFNVNDMKGDFTIKEKFDILRKWMIDIQKDYDFEKFICKIDNGDDDNDAEVYFDSTGRKGDLYHNL